METLSKLRHYQRISENKIKFPNAPGPLEILNEICRIFDQEYEMVKGDCRKRDLVMCRMIFGYMSILLCQSTFNDIGLLIDRDHTTIIHYRDSVTVWVENEDEKFMEKWVIYTRESKIWKEYGRKASSNTPA